MLLPIQIILYIFIKVINYPSDNYNSLPSIHPGLENYRQNSWWGKCLLQFLCILHWMISYPIFCWPYFHAGWIGLPLFPDCLVMQFSQALWNIEEPFDTNYATRNCWLNKIQPIGHSKNLPFKHNTISNIIPWKQIKVPRVLASRYIYLCYLKWFYFSYYKAALVPGISLLK